MLAVREVENARDCLTEQRQEAGGPPEAPPRASAAGPDDPVTQQKAVGEEGGTRESMSPSVVVIVAPEPPAVEPAAAEPRPLVVQDYPTAGPASPTKENGAHAHTYAEPSEATAKAMMPPPGISPRTAKQNHALEPPWKKPAVPPASGVPPPRPAAATPDAAAALSSGGRYNLPSGNLSIPPNLLPGPNQSLLDSPVLLTTMTASSPPPSWCPFSSMSVSCSANPANTHALYSW